MNLTLRIVLFVGIVLYIGFILAMLRKKRMDLKYSLLWFLTALVLLVLDVFPGIAKALSGLLGFETQSNFIFLVVLFFVLLLLVSMTSIVSKQRRQIRSLIQKTALLEKRIEELEKNAL